MAQESQGRLKHLASEMGIQFLYGIVMWLLLIIGRTAYWFGRRPNYSTNSSLPYLLQVILIAITVLLTLNALSWLLSKDDKKTWPIFPVCFGMIGLVSPLICVGTLPWTAVAIFSSLGYGLLSGLSATLQFNVPDFKKRLIAVICLLGLMGSLIFLVTPKVTFPFGKDDTQKTKWLTENYGTPFKALQNAATSNTTLKTLMGGAPQMRFPDTFYLYQSGRTIYGWFELAQNQLTLECYASKHQKKQRIECKNKHMEIHLHDIEKTTAKETVYIYDGANLSNIEQHFAPHQQTAKTLLTDAEWISTFMGNVRQHIQLTNNTPFTTRLDKVAYTDLVHQYTTNPKLTALTITFRMTAKTSQQEGWFCAVSYTKEQTARTPKTHTIQCHDPTKQVSITRNHTGEEIVRRQHATTSKHTLLKPWPLEKAKAKLLTIAKKEPDLHANNAHIRLAKARDDFGGRVVYIHTPIAKHTPEVIEHRLYKEDATFFFAIDHPQHRALCRVSVSTTDKPLKDLLDTKTICWTATHRMVFDHNNQRSEHTQKDQHIRKRLNPKKKTKPKKKINF